MQWSGLYSSEYYLLLLPVARAVPCYEKLTLRCSGYVTSYVQPRRECDSELLICDVLTGLHIARCEREGCELQIDRPHSTTLM